MACYVTPRLLCLLFTPPTLLFPQLAEHPPSKPLHYGRAGHQRHLYYRTFFVMTLLFSALLILPVLCAFRLKVHVHLSLLF